jgi:hypothetical protein
MLRAARRRAALDAVAVGAPAALVAAAAGWRLSGVAGALVAALVGLAALGAVARRRASRLDARWLAARLDGGVPAFEDSAELLFEDAQGLQGLAALQRRRLEDRIARALPVDPGPPWSLRAIAFAWSVGLLLAVLPLAWPAEEERAGREPAGAGVKAAEAARIAGFRARVAPPAYTGLPAREHAEPDLRVPAGARVEWTVRFAGSPGSAALAFAEGDRLPLRRDGDRWTAARVAARPTLYRIEAEGLPRQPLRRLDVVADAPPVVALVSPAERLTTAASGQTRWTPVFEATDDYGVDAAATLRITVTAGEGEQITATTRQVAVRGTGGGRRARFAVPLDLARETLEPGGDLIVQLVVRDNRRPTPQVAEGPSVILRRPSEAERADGLEGLLTRVMPAYLRSQRQIVIDAEALVRERRRLSDDVFFQRSNALANDQAALRLRYGRFLGEEAEGEAALPTSDTAAPPLPTSDAPAPAARAETAETHSLDDGHGHAADEFDSEGRYVGPRDLAERFGHVHDDADSAVFDPQTRSLLARALNAMWGSERELRQSRPEAALPHARAALEALKEAQQASRVHLPRVGSRLPPIDPTRRLTGKREGIAPVRPPAGESAFAFQADAAEAWRALEDRPGAPPLRLDALERWALVNRDRLADPLALIAAIDGVRLDPDCGACRSRLRAALWDALEAPASVRRREGADVQGRRYLEALR